MRDVALLSAHGGPGRRSARDRASHVNDVDDGSLLWRAAHIQYRMALLLSAGSTALGAHSCAVRTASSARRTTRVRPVRVTAGVAPLTPLTYR